MKIVEGNIKEYDSVTLKSLKAQLNDKTCVFYRLLEECESDCKFSGTGSCIKDSCSRCVYASPMLIACTFELDTLINEINRIELNRDA